MIRNHMDSVKTAVDLANQRNTSQGIQDNNIRTPQASQQQLPTRHRQLDKPIILQKTCKSLAYPSI